ncbi:hypothetical protein C8R45DRAFT_936752 [Mycena sanguinolenta]|nr:hypothetical protein C8R45DRAFT_936752 [Mycena sanguinolenta]
MMKREGGKHGTKKGRSSPNTFFTAPATAVLSTLSLPALPTFAALGTLAALVFRGLGAGLSPVAAANVVSDGLVLVPLVDADAGGDRGELVLVVRPALDVEEAEDEIAREVYTTDFANSLDAAEDDKPTTAEALLALERVGTRGGVRPVRGFPFAPPAPPTVSVLEAVVGTGMPRDLDEVAGDEDEAPNDDPAHSV